MGKNNQGKQKLLTERVEDSGLTITQERVAVALAVGMSVSRISADLGVPTSTIYDWRQQAHFAAHYKRLQREAVREIRGKLSQMADVALATIREIIDGGGEQARLKAACYILDYMTGYQRESKRLKLKAQAAVRNAKK